jgi:hypothetical protein
VNAASEQARTKEKLFVQKKARRLYEEALIEIERHQSIQDSRKFYKRLNNNHHHVLAGWKEHFEEHLNKSSESEQPTRPVDLRNDGVEIDWPSREEIEGSLKCLINNKAAGTDSIAAEMLKDGGPNLVDALHEVIQQAWTSETLPRSWIEVQCTEKAINSIVKTIEGRDLPLERDMQSFRQNSMRPPFTPH